MLRILKPNLMDPYQMPTWVKIQITYTVCSKMCHISACILTNWLNTLENKYPCLTKKIWEIKIAENVALSLKMISNILMKFQSTQLFRNCKKTQRKQIEMTAKKVIFKLNNWLNKSRLKSNFWIGSRVAKATHIEMMIANP